MFLSQHQLQILVSSHIFSQLDYCNAVYYGLPAYSIKKLQHVQNCAARLVWKGHRSFNSSLERIFMSLHWLKVKFRIIYKVLLIVHNCLHGKAPQDISALITYAPSERRMLLLETRVMSSYGDRAFSHAAPKLWNLLPMKIREEPVQDEFKKALKTFLMEKGEQFISWTKIK